MDILFVTSDPLEYPTSANLRNRGLIQGLIENGHTVTSVSLEPQEEAISVELNVINALSKRYFIPLSLVHANLTTKKRDSFWLRALKQTVYKIRKYITVYDARIRYVDAASKVTLNENYDIMISSSDPKSVHRMAEAILKSNRGLIKKWVQYWGDPFASDINSAGWWKKSLMAREEEDLIKLANYSIYVSPITLSDVRNQYAGVSSKTAFIPTPYRDERIYPPTINKNFNILYAGDYFKNDRNIEPLLDAVTSVSGVNLTLIGRSDVRIEKRDEIQVLDRVSPSELETFESKADLLVCIANRKGNQIPGKFFQTAGTNKQILLIMDGERAKEIGEYFDSFHRYIICSNDSTAIKRQILKQIETPSIEMKPLRDFSPQVVAEEFANVLINLTLMEEGV